jgi:hypothetical protein
MFMVTAPPANEAVTNPDGGLKLKTAAEQGEWIAAAQAKRRTAVLVQKLAKATMNRQMIRALWIWHFTGKIPVLWLATNTGDHPFAQGAD